MIELSEARSKAVFLFDTPNVYQLKACSLFWNNIVVYEGYIQELGIGEKDTSEEPSLVHTLLRENILKILQTPEELKSGLHDKIYAGLDETLWKYIYDNAPNLTVQAKLPSDAQDIVNASTKLDEQNSELKKLYDSTVWKRTTEEWNQGLSESQYYPYANVKLKEDMEKIAMDLAKWQYEHFHGSRPVDSRYKFRSINKCLIEQLTVSSALCSDTFHAAMFGYKMGNFSIKDARTFFSGIDVIVPLADKNSISDYSIQQILSLRKNSKWNKAMDRLADLCYRAKSESDSSQFKERLTKEIISDYQTALDEEKVTIKEPATDIAKGLAYTGVSLIPIVGNAVSLAAGVVDPVISYLAKRESQKNLPFFLNDMKKL